NIKSDTSSINHALAIWIKKYKELKLEIDKITDKSLHDRLLFNLNQGEFPLIEKTLALRTNYKELYRIFPETYQTSGNQSPVIIGDFATVTYIVEEVVN